MHCKFYGSSENTVLAASLIPRSLWIPRERRHCSTRSCKAADKQELLMRMDTATQLPCYQCGNWDSYSATDQPQHIPLFFPSSGTRRRSQPASWPAQFYRPLGFKPCNCESHWVIIQEAILLSQWDFPYWGQQWVFQHPHPPLKTCTCTLWSTNSYQKLL